MRYSDPDRHRIRDHDRAIQWRFAATQPNVDGSRSALSLRLVRALAIAVACGSMYIVDGVT